MEDYKVNICTHCNGWGVNHIPVQSKLEICDVCKGKAVFMESVQQLLVWDDWRISDLRPSVFTSRVVNKENLKTLGLLFLLAVLVLWILSSLKILSIDFFDSITKFLGLS